MDVTFWSIRYRPNKYFRASLARLCSRLQMHSRLYRDANERAHSLKKATEELQHPVRPLFLSFSPACSKRAENVNHRGEGRASVGIWIPSTL